MVLGFDRLQALRDCCRDEAAFLRLRQILGIPTEELHAGPGTPNHSRLLSAVAQATSQLLTGSNFTVAINTALAILGETTGADRVYIFSVHPHPETGEPASTQRFEWVRDAITPQLNNPAMQNRSYAAAGITRWHEMLQSGRTISGLVDQFPASERQILVAQDIRAVLIVPILINGLLWGCIGFDDCHTDRHWSQDEEAALHLMASSIGGAIARSQAETALYQSRSRIQKIAGNVPGMLYQFLRQPNGQYCLVYASSGCRELLELEPDVVQSDFVQLLNLSLPEDRKSWQQSIEESAATLQPWNWEGRIVTPSGKFKWLQGFSRPEPQADGGLLWDGLLVDITDRKLAEEECRRSEARYRAMLDASPDLMFRIDRQGKYLDFKGNNQSAVPLEAIVGKSLSDLLPPDIATLCLNAIHKTLDTGVLQTCEYRLPEPEGPRDYEARLVVSGADEVLWIVQDVTTRKRFEVELRDSEERLQSFFNATFEAVIIHDYRRILDVNPAAERLFGYSAAEMTGMSVLEIATESSRDEIRKHWRSLTAPDQPYEYEATGLRKDGSTFIATVSVKPIHYRGEEARVASIRDITERRCQEEVIRQSEAHNRALLNAVPDLMFRMSRDGTYVYCKAERDEDILMPRSEIIGKNVYDVLPADLAAERMRYVEQALSTGKLQSYEYQLRLNSEHPVNGVHPQSGAGEPLSSLDPMLHYYEARIVVSGEDEVLAMVRDITERKRAEQALHLSQEKFFKAFRSSPNPMSIATLLDGELKEVNDGFCQVMGYDRSEVIGKRAHDLGIWVNPEDRVRAVAALQSEGSIRNMECQFRVKSGEVRVGLFSAEMITIGNDQFLIDVVADITERKRAEERDRLLGEIALRIRRSLELEQILNTTVAEVRQFLKADRVCIGHHVVDGTAKIVAESVDPRWKSMLGQVIQDPAHLQELREAFMEDQARVIDNVDQALLTPISGPYLAEFQVQAALGVPLLLEDKFYGLMVVHQCQSPRHWEPHEVEFLRQLGTQVSIAVQQANLYAQLQELNAGLERKVQERTLQLQQKNEELQELNDLKDEFLNAFSHDLKTPVMGISLVISNLLNQPGDTIPLTRSILQRMKQSSDHQLQLIKSMLEAHSAETRGVSLQPELVQLSLLVQVIVEDVEPIVVKNRATLTNQVPPDLPLVNADPVQLRRVFENLITNALHHNPPGVHITLDAEIEEEMIRFTLQDDGVGMSQETRDRLFQRYTRGPKSRHSTGIGLGLYLCRQIITAHGGQIGVDSVPGEGSTFWITLPLAIPSGANPAIAEG